MSERPEVATKAPRDYQPGEKAPASGIYSSPDGRQETTLRRGERFPPARAPWRLVRRTAVTTVAGRRSRNTYVPGPRTELVRALQRVGQSHVEVQLVVHVHECSTAQIHHLFEGLGKLLRGEADVR